MSSGEKKPMPQSPIIPETPRKSPTMVFFLHRGCRKSSKGEPTFFWEIPAAASAFALSQDSGSRSRNIVGITRSDGRIPMKKRMRQPEKSPMKFSEPGLIFKLTTDPRIFPMADKA